MPPEDALTNSNTIRDGTEAGTGAVEMAEHAEGEVAPGSGTVLAGSIVMRE